MESSFYKDNPILSCNQDHTSNSTLDSYNKVRAYPCQNLIQKLLQKMVHV